MTRLLLVSLVTLTK